VVLSGNPLTIAHRDLHTITVLQTIKDGQVVYEAVPSGP
jgi:predicted amidohydrolase YtcJ